MDNQAGQRCVKYSGQVVGTSKPYKNRRQQKQRHTRKEKVIETVSGQTQRALRGIGGACNDGGHRVSVTAYRTKLSKMDFLASFGGDAILRYAERDSYWNGRRASRRS